MGGGTGWADDSRAPSMGLSPRGRGNLLQARRGQPRRRSIPAWAGEPVGGMYPVTILGVYPRVGGGTDPARRRTGRSGGLSPRGRGNPLQLVDVVGVPRSIPAWAGEPPGRRCTPGTRWVYPRVGGGTNRRFAARTIIVGLSPRGRGNLGLPGFRRLQDGSIPAWAGEPDPHTPTSTWPPVYPRVGGGTGRPRRSSMFGFGLSPRGRGNHARRDVDIYPGGSIPAWAGEPSRLSSVRRARPVYPRVGGGTESYEIAAVIV